MVAWKPKFMTVFCVTTIVFLITFFLLIFRLFGLGLVGIAFLSMLLPVLLRLSSEEWVIFVVKRHGGTSQYTKDAPVTFSKRAALRLEKRGVLTIENGTVVLQNPTYPCIFDEHRQ